MQLKEEGTSISSSRTTRPPTQELGARPLKLTKDKAPFRPRLSEPGRPVAWKTVWEGEGWGAEGGINAVRGSSLLLTVTPVLPVPSPGTLRLEQRASLLSGTHRLTHSPSGRREVIQRRQFSSRGNYVRTGAFQSLFHGHLRSHRP